MAYSIVGIVNLCFVRIGVKRISAIDESTPQAQDANAIWEYIRDLVLEAKDWKFAKERVKLTKSATTPGHTWAYAYILPSNFLRLAKSRDDDPAVYPTTYDEVDYPYIIETLSDDSKVLMSNFDNTSEDYYATIIKRVTDPTKYSAHFISTAAFRMGAELSISRTEDPNKYKTMMQLYELELKKAEGVNQSFDHQEDAGNSDWENAGR